MAVRDFCKGDFIKSPFVIPGLTPEQRSSR